jgi:3-isopropylmalate/(R)-2-methylmalate dehydratase large subunit
MAMTITEKILAVHAGREEVRPGEIVRVNVDLALANDITAPLAIGEFEKAGAKEVFDRDKVVLVPDHFAPTAKIEPVKMLPNGDEFSYRAKAWLKGYLPDEAEERTRTVRAVNLIGRY